MLKIALFLCMALFAVDGWVMDNEEKGGDSPSSGRRKISFENRTRTSSLSALLEVAGPIPEFSAPVNVSVKTQEQQEREEKEGKLAHIRNIINSQPPINKGAFTEQLDSIITGGRLDEFLALYKPEILMCGSYSEGQKNEGFAIGVALAEFTKK